MSNGHLVTIHWVDIVDASVGVSDVVAHHLIAVHVVVLPLLGASAFLEPEDAAVEIFSSLQVMNRNRQVEGAAFFVDDFLFASAGTRGGCRELSFHIAACQAGALSSLLQRLANELVSEKHICQL